MNQKNKTDLESGKKYSQGGYDGEVKMQGGKKKRSQRQHRHWHRIIKSNRRRVITTPNRPEGFQFPHSLRSNGPGISEKGMRRMAARGEKGSPPNAVGHKSAAFEKLLLSR